MAQPGACDILKRGSLLGHWGLMQCRGGLRGPGYPTSGFLGWLRRCHYLPLLQLPQEGAVTEESGEVPLVVGESP